MPSKNRRFIVWSHAPNGTPHPPREVRADSAETAARLHAAERWRGIDLDLAAVSQNWPELEIFATPRTGGGPQRKFTVTLTMTMTSLCEADTDRATMPTAGRKRVD